MVFTSDDFNVKLSDSNVKILNLLNCDGISIEELMEKMGYKRHTVRARLCELRKMGLCIKSFNNHYCSDDRKYKYLLRLVIGE